MNRQVILTVILLLLGGVAVYMYQGMIMDYAGPVVKPAMEMVGLGGETETTAGDDTVEMDDTTSGDTAPIPPADRLVEQSYFNLTQSFQRTFNLPVHDTSVWSDVDGISVDGEFRLRVPESISAEMPWDRLAIDYALTSHSSGNGKGSLTVRRPDNLPVQAIEFQKNSSAFQLVFPDEGQYFRGTAGSDSPGQQSGGMAFQVDTGLPDVRDSEVTATTWEGRDVYAVEVTQEGTVPATLYTTTSQPYSLVGVKHEGDTESRTVVVTYRDESRDMFSTVEIRGQRSGLMDFQYGNDRLQTARFTPDSSDQYQWIQLSLSHGDQYSNGGGLTVSTGSETEPIEFGTFEWAVDNEQLSRLIMEFSIPVAEDSASMTIGMNSISWLQDPDSVELSDTSGLTRLSRSELGEKFMPLMMMAASGMNQTGGTTTDNGESERERTATPSQPTETESEEQASPEPEDPTTQQASQPAEQQPEDEPEPEPATEPTESEPQPPSDESTEGVETPANSGETIRYSSVGRFPMSEPPEAYEEARQAYGNGDFSRAEEVLTPLVEEYPNSANANYLLGVIHFEQGNFEEAIPYFEQASELEHDPQIKVWSEQYLDRIDDRTS